MLSFMEKDATKYSIVWNSVNKEAIKIVRIKASIASFFSLARIHRFLLMNGQRSIQLYFFLEFTVIVSYHLVAEIGFGDTEFFCYLLFKIIFNLDA